MFKLRIILLSAFLLLSQSGMLLHELDADHYASGHSQCEICLSINGLDTALSNVSSDIALLFWSNADKLPQPVFDRLPRTTSLYQTRAPPSVG